MKESELGENVWIVVAPGRTAGAVTPDRCAVCPLS